MANRFNTPYPQFFNSNPSPYVGGNLFFYITGTSTPLNTYANQGLTIPNPNPVPLLADGRPKYDIWLQNAPYKVVLEDVNNNVIWTADPVETSDYSTPASFQVYNGNPNGFVAGTAGTVGGNNSSVIWDYVDNILYICTTTGNAASAVWTAINSSTASPVNPAPSGYLTLSSDPFNYVLTADSIGSTAVYYSPVTGNLCPIWNGASFINTAFTQLTLALAASHAANTLYDVFMFLNSGVPTICTGPAWSNSTAGTCARGTGVGTTQLSRVNGLIVNTVQFNGRNGATTYNNVPANQATYLGTIYVDATAGQVTCHRTWGQNRKWGVWNYYNRVPITLQCGDSTASWFYNTATIRASDAAPATWSSTEFNVGSGTSCNGITTLCGVNEELIQCEFTQFIGGLGGGAVLEIGVGLNSTTAFSGTQGQINYANIALSTVVATYTAPPPLGISTIVALEKYVSSAGGTFSGTQALMSLTTQYRG